MSDFPSVGLADGIYVGVLLSDVQVGEQFEADPVSELVTAVACRVDGEWLLIQTTGIVDGIPFDRVGGRVPLENYFDRETPAVAVAVKDRVPGAYYAVERTRSGQLDFALWLGYWAVFGSEEGADKSDFSRIGGRVDLSDYIPARGLVRLH